MRVLTLAVASAAATALCGASSIEPSVLLMHEHPTFMPRRNDTCCHASAHLQEVLSLSELPLDRLLRVRVAMHPSTFDQVTTEVPVDLRDNDDLEVEDEPPDEVDGEALPQPEALRSRHRSRRPHPPLQRGDLIETGSGQSLGTKQSKLATGFQLAITVLSFLAFGAYLISLVVSIVRNNNSTATAATTQQPFVLVPATAGRRKRRRADPPWIPPRLPEPEHVFDVITSVAQAYAKFEGHELDN